MSRRLFALATGLCALLLAGVPATRTSTAADVTPPGDVLPFRLLYGNPGPLSSHDTAGYLWSEGGRLHLRITAGPARREVAGEFRAIPSGVLKDVLLEEGNVRIRQPIPSLLQFDLRTDGTAEEFSVALAGDIETLRVDLRIDGRPRPTALRIGRRQERPKGLPADLALTGARASWIERFGFN